MLTLGSLSAYLPPASRRLGLVGAPAFMFPAYPPSGGRCPHGADASAAQHIRQQHEDRGGPGLAGLHRARLPDRVARPATHALGRHRRRGHVVPDRSRGLHRLQPGEPTIAK